jgi:hypothetical protein
MRRSPSGAIEGAFPWKQAEHRQVGGEGDAS